MSGFSKRPNSVTFWDNVRKFFESFLLNENSAPALLEPVEQKPFKFDTFYHDDIHEFYKNRIYPLNPACAR